MDSLWAILRGYRKAAGKCPNSRLKPIGEKVELPIGYWKKCGNIISILSFFRSAVFLFILIKSQWRSVKI
jgi:hypothetical protein